MNLHSGARSCPASRTLLIERIRRGTRVTEAAQAAGISRRTAYKWIARHAREGVEGLRDRSSRPLSSPTALTVEEVCCIVWLRQCRTQCEQPVQPCSEASSARAELRHRSGPRFPDPCRRSSASTVRRSSATPRRTGLSREV